MKYQLNPFDEAKQLASQHGEWVVAAVETELFWPKKMQVVSYEGKDFIFLPSGDPTPPLYTRQLPAICLRADAYNLTREEARREIMRFASALSWHERGKIEIVTWTGGNIPRSMGIMRNNGIVDYLSSEHLPTAINDKSAAALAFYREGVSLDNPFYAFFSFYKAFSVAIPDGQKRSQWIKAKRSEIDNTDAKKRAEDLESQGIDVGNYLYEQGRHAIAHADREPFVNPDNTDDHFRLSLDLPLMRNFTELAIEDRLGIKRRNTVYREHLFELQGFRNLIPKDVIDSFKRLDGKDVTFEMDLPDHFTLIAQKGHEQFPLEQMKIVQAICISNGLVIDLESPHATIKARVILNFADEKMVFDPLQHFGIISNREKQESVQEELAAVQFYRCILSNGHLEIWDPVKNKRLGCSEAYIPINCMVNDDFFNQLINELEVLLRG
jgi:hypothetical protein